MTRTPSRGARLRLEPLEDRTTPATFNVTTTLDAIDASDGKRSLREAINQANALAGADTIVLPAGVYKIALAGADEDGNLTGDFDITDPLTIQGAGAGLTVIDGQQLDRVFDVRGTTPSSIKVVLQALTVRNGKVSDLGGGIQVGNGDLVVRDCVVTGNRSSESGGGISNVPRTANVTLVRTTVGRNVASSSGGGISVAGISELTVRDSTVRRNVTGNNGGGIFADTAKLTNSTVSGNTASGAGGGIRVSDTATLTNSTVSGNKAGNNGGGIDSNTATLTNCTVSGNVGLDGGGITSITATLTNCTVSGNFAVSDGGGIDTVTATLTNCTVSGNSTANFSGGIASNTATLLNCTVSGNSAVGGGGGIFASTAATLTNTTVSGNSAGTIGGGIAAPTAILTNCTVSGNSAGTEGGGIRAAAATLLNCTVVENIAVTGGGLFHVAGGTFNVRNTIIALNLVDFTGVGPDVSGGFASGGHNLIGDASGSTGFGINFDIVGTAANPIDLMLGPLANNGGKTKTHALLAGSPAIDAGDNTALPLTDQRGAGFPRRKDGDGNGTKIVDIGAFEK